MEYIINTQIINNNINIEAIQIKTKVGYKTEQPLDNIMSNFNNFELIFTNLGNKLLINCKYQEHEFDLFLDEIKINYGDYIYLLDKINKINKLLENVNNNQQIKLQKLVDNINNVQQIEIQKVLDTMELKQNKQEIKLQEQLNNFNNNQQIEMQIEVQKLLDTLELKQTNEQIKIRKLLDNFNNNYQTDIQQLLYKIELKQQKEQVKLQELQNDIKQINLDKIDKKINNIEINLQKIEQKIYNYEIDLIQMNTKINTVEQEIKNRLIILGDILQKQQLFNNSTTNFENKITSQYKNLNNKINNLEKLI